MDRVTKPRTRNTRGGILETCSSLSQDFIRVTCSESKTNAGIWQLVRNVEMFTTRVYLTVPKFKCAGYVADTVKMEDGDLDNSVSNMNGFVEAASELSPDEFTWAFLGRLQMATCIADMANLAHWPLPRCTRVARELKAMLNEPNEAPRVWVPEVTSLRRLLETHLQCPPPLSTLIVDYARSSCRFCGNVIDSSLTFGSVRRFSSNDRLKEWTCQVPDVAPKSDLASKLCTACRLYPTTRENRHVTSSTVEFIVKAEWIRLLIVPQPTNDQLGLYRLSVDLVRRGETDANGLWI